MRGLVVLPLIVEFEHRKWSVMFVCIGQGVCQGADITPGHIWSGNSNISLCSWCPFVTCVFQADVWRQEFVSDQECFWSLTQAFVQHRALRLPLVILSCSLQQRIAPRHKNGGFQVILGAVRSCTEAPSAGPRVQQSNWISFSWTGSPSHVLLRCSQWKPTLLFIADMWSHVRTGSITSHDTHVWVCVMVCSWCLHCLQGLQYKIIRSFFNFTFYFSSARNIKMCQFWQVVYP